ncbi:MAG TPA: hypothetical protein VJ001_15850 [Rhodocyclaceae bacterium]|nr:hypothetical protein [Rhodocyclaceae bacterium]
MINSLSRLESFDDDAIMARAIRQLLATTYAFWRKPPCCCLEVAASLGDAANDALEIYCD